MNIVKTRRNKSKKLFFGIILIISVGFVGYGLYGLWSQYTATHQTPKSIQSESIVTHSTSTPDETPPMCDTYSVPDSQPRYINLPTIDAAGCIQKVGIDQNNAMAVPNNIYLAGWYVNSVAPGQKGLSVIDGHSGGRYSDGIFKNLVKIAKNDIFSVEFGDKSVREFRVVNVSTYSVEEAAQKMLERDPNIQTQLNLITCGNDYNSEINGYNDRILVVATIND